MIALAAAAMSTPMLSLAGGASVLDQCVQAFMSDLSNRGAGTLKLRESHYEPDQMFSPFRDSAGALTLTAHDAHDNHAVARAVCTVNSHGEVDLRAEPLVADNLH
jgi:hypothetical protein